MLLEAEARAAQQRAVVLGARVRRSLRQAGLGRRGRPRGRRAAPGSLSPREAEVLSLVGQGLSSSQVALRLGVARSTVDAQVRSAMRKLGARTRIEAAVLAAD
jgi:DNA-binding CsgD family transcriptional regulator